MMRLEEGGRTGKRVEWKREEEIGRERRVVKILLRQDPITNL